MSAARGIQRDAAAALAVPAAAARLQAPIGPRCLQLRSTIVWLEIPMAKELDPLIQSAGVFYLIQYLLTSSTCRST